MSSPRELVACGEATPVRRAKNRYENQTGVGRKAGAERRVERTAAGKCQQEVAERTVPSPRRAEPSLLVRAAEMRGKPPPEQQVDSPARPFCNALHTI